MGNSCSACCKKTPDLELKADNNTCCSWWKCRSKCGEKCLDCDDDRCYSNCCVVNIYKSNSRKNIQQEMSITPKNSPDKI